MNTCKRYKELLLTDYIDGELDAEARKNIDDHLLVCGSCRQFREDVAGKVINVFGGADHPDAPANLWPSIKERIIQKRFAEAEAVSVSCFFKRLFGLLAPLPRLVPAVSVVAVLILASVMTFRFYRAENLYQAEQAEYIVSSLNGTGTFPAETGVNFETRLEEYFL